MALDRPVALEHHQTVAGSAVRRGDVGRRLGPAPGELAWKERERIIFVTDGGPAGFAATWWIARRSRSRLLDVQLILLMRFGRLRRARAVRRLSQATDVLREVAPAVRATHRLVRGGLEGVRELTAGADLLVLATNRRTALRRYLPATFTSRVLAATDCGVLLVPRRWEPTDRPVVVGVGMPHSDDRAIDFAAAEAWSRDGELHLVHVWRPLDPLGRTPAASLGHAPNYLAAVAELDAAERRAKRQHPGLRTVSYLQLGEVVPTLRGFGAVADTIVVGSHRETLTGTALLVSVGGALAAGPPCALALLPPLTSPAVTSRV
jgi:nucleotide-binding universal stress UspA family protein